MGVAALDRAFQQGLAFFVAFILSGLALIFTLALTESFTPLHVPLGPGRTILAWAIGCAAVAMGLRAAGRARRRIDASAGARMNGAEAGPGPPRQQKASARNRSIEAEALRLQAEVEIAQALEVNEDGNKPIDPMTARAMEAARWRPILFREMFPPPADPGLSFYGGVPVGPTGMIWPREEDGTPLTFLMQWECAALARLDPTDLLPKSGALYLFSTLRWGDAMHFRFLHQQGDHWRPLTVPADLPPAFGEDAAHSSPMVSARIPAERRDAPQLLPCWPFSPVTIDYPRAEPEEYEHPFWADKLTAELLVHAQDMTGALVPEPGSRRLEGRPFAGFPHDWAAVRVIATEALKSLDRIADYQWKGIAPEADMTVRETLVDGWRAEARALYEEATSHPAGEAVPRDEADRLWQRMEPLAQVITLCSGTVTTSINVSLGLGSDGLSVVPADEIEACGDWHRLGKAYLRQEYEREFQARSGLAGPIEAARAKWLHSKESADMAAFDALSKGAFAQFNLAKEAGTLEQHRQVFAPTPNRMFGPPSYVQGLVEDYVGEWLLLLELVSRDSIGFGLGDGVIQFMIRPGDLAAERFDQIEVIASAN
jgi:hypothetical protein